tara:strand:- start:2585 stop:2854 length:270 start_codon:yes stop_codon:yes gene_type:complete
MELINPCGVFEVKGAPLTPRKQITADTVVGLFANDKKNADVLLSHVKELLAQRFNIKKFVWFKKQASAPAAFTDQFIAECDVVAAAVCD